MKVTIINVGKKDMPKFDVDLSTETINWGNFYRENNNLISQLRENIIEHICKDKQRKTNKQLDPDDFLVTKIDFGDW